AVGAWGLARHVYLENPWHHNILNWARFGWTLPAPGLGVAFGLGAAGAVALLLGPLPPRPRVRRYALGVARVTAGLAVGLAVVEPALGDWGEVPPLLVLAAAAIALVLLGWERIGASGAVEERDPPSLHGA